MPQVVVIDYGSGNVGSVMRALQAIANSHTITLSSEPQQITQAERIVFPGQSNMKQCMSQLKKTGLDEVIKQVINTKPFLGICVGLQVLMDKSEENNGIDGLGVITGDVVKFPQGQKDQQNYSYKIPQIGWNQVSQQISHPLWQGIETDSYFYFAHSYYIKLKSANNSAGETDYIFPYTSAIATDNLFATQFHPEKSQHNGLQLLKNFLDWQP